MGVSINQNNGTSVSVQQNDSTAVSLSTPAPPSVSVSSFAVGSGDAHYTHTQSSATDQWVVTHNMNKFPSVTIVDDGNNILITEVLYNSANQLTVLFNAAESGKAYLN